MKYPKIIKKLPYKFLLFLTAIIAGFVLLEIIIGRVASQRTFSQLEAESLNCFKSSTYNIFALRQGQCVFSTEDYQATATINSKGFRGAEIDKKEKPRILIEGDSFVYGFGVNDNETFPYKLGELLTNFEVINAGFASGFGPDSYYVHLINDGLELKPDIVIFGIFVFNDISDLQETEWIKVDESGLPLSVQSAKRIVSEKGYFRNRNEPFEYRFKIMRESQAGIFLTKYFKKGIARVVNPVKYKLWQMGFDVRLETNVADYNCFFRNVCSRDQNRLFEEIGLLAWNAKQKSSDAGSDFFVLLIPADFQIYSDSYKKYQSHLLENLYLEKTDNLYPQKKLKQIFQARGIQYFDLTGSLRQNNNEKLYFEKDGHFTKIGNEVVASIIAEYINKNF